MGSQTPFLEQEPACGILQDMAKQEIKTMLRQWYETYWKEVSRQKRAKAFLKKLSSCKVRTYLSHSVLIDPKKSLGKDPGGNEKMAQDKLRGWYL